jgi:predicted anti-sigma-YlaC factor YlaD
MNDRTQDCAVHLEALSAELDGEPHGLVPGALESHLDACPGCRNYRDFVHSLRRATLHEAPPMDDLAPRIIKSARVGSMQSRWGAARAILAVCAVEVIVFSVMDLFRGSHDSRHLGSFSIAFAVVLLSVVFRPARARMMLPVAAVLALGLAITAAVDLATGNVPLLTEARHLPEIASVAMLWMLARPVRAASVGVRRPLTWTPTVVERNRDTA